MRRIVYSPKAFVYILTDAGMFNVSDYVVSGSISRKINQVSTAEVTLQNPYRKFTQPGDPTFRPMDRITVFLQRLPGLPCQVFTGYLDETPYYQMYPGTCTLRASCTLKKLNYVWFDPGLPFMNKFMQQYGWIFDGSGSIQGTPWDDPNTVADQKQSNTMSDLLFAVLKHIAGIDSGKILIEDLPPELINRIAKIYEVLQSEQQEIDQKFQEWIKAFIGESSLGTGGMSDSTGDNASGIPYAGTITKWARTYNFEPALIAAIIERESGFDPGATGHDPGGTVGQGLMQLTTQTYKDWWQSYIDAGDDSISANVHAGVRALREKVDAVGGDIWLGVKAYNGSGAAADEYMNDIKNNRYPKFKQKFADAGGASTDSGNTTSGNLDSGSLGTSGLIGGISGGTTEDNTTDQSSSSTTRYDAIVAEANRLSKLAKSGKMPYGPERPPVHENDCSSSVSSLLRAAGYQIGWETTVTIENALGSNMVAGRDPTNRVTFWVRNSFQPHIWAMINGRPFSTHSGEGGQWVDDYYAKDSPESNGFSPFHIKGLDDPHDVPANSDTSSGSTGSEATEGFADALQAAKAGSLFTTLEFPSAVDVAESTLLTGERSLMNDQPLMPFIEQLCKGTLRSFQSLPNGDFYAWHADYFGAFGTAPYWEIDDIEVLSGNIQLSDDALVTHSYVVGATNADQNITIDRRIQTRGVVTILNAGNADFLNINPKDVKEKVQKKKEDTSKSNSDPVEEPFLGDYDAALKFLNRYGARPVVEDAPFIRSHAFETFYAFQNFMLAWSRQFLTTFTFTFMPELYPGGIVKFKDHGIAMYIDEVQHTWDYTSGFTTQANLSAPSSTGENNDKAGISRGMVLQTK